MYEDTFILNAARINLSEKNITVLKKISSNGIDWDLFAQKASKHEVSTFIYNSLKNHGLLEILPQEISKIFKTEYYRIAVENHLLLDGFSKLSKIITNKIIPLKGIELIQSLYPNIAIRAMGDIDILIEKDHALDNRDKLLQCNLGWRSSSGKSRLHEVSSIDLYGHLPPIYAKTFWLEIHCNIFGVRKLYQISKYAWEKSILKDNNIYRLSNETMLIHLCSHFFKHLQTFAILRMLCDINEFIIKYKNIIDWAEIERICNDPDLKNEVDMALTYSYTLLGTPIPPTFVSEKILNNSYITISSLLNGNNISKKSSKKNFLGDLKYFTNPIDKIVFLFRTIVPVKAWMSIKCDVTTKGKLFKAYLNFWHYLINKHILKKGSKKYN